MAEKLTRAVGQEPTKPKAQRNQRTAFDGPGTTSAVTLAVKPRQAAYKAGWDCDYRCCRWQCRCPPPQVHAAHTNLKAVPAGRFAGKKNATGFSRGGCL